MSIAPSQILYLEHGSARLYAEAIQIITERHLCWARPTLLIQGLPEAKDLAEGESLAAERQAVISTAAIRRSHYLSEINISHNNTSHNNTSDNEASNSNASNSHTSSNITLKEDTHSGLQLYDLEDAPDLIWPQTLFEIAYDLDFFTLLVQLKMNPDTTAVHSSSQQLNHFLRSFWQSHPHIFPSAQETSDSPSNMTSSTTSHSTGRSAPRLQGNPTQDNTPKNNPLKNNPRQDKTMRALSSADA